MSHLHERRIDLSDVADARLLFVASRNRKVLAEGAERFVKVA